jgi:catechol 2,3-dioxygenase-like lactoylglutathione lyase family enzyme
MPLDHVSIGCKDVKKAKGFYDAVLAPLGFQPVMPVEVGGHLVAVGYGDAGQPTFWVQLPFNRQPASFGNGVHVAFSAKDRAGVDAFYLNAMDMGGIDDGQPGLRTEYHPNYYGAFIRDPDGNKIEAVCHAPG